MIGTIYKNRKLYYNMMKDFIIKKISILDIQEKVLSENHKYYKYLYSHCPILKKQLSNKKIFTTNSISLLSHIEEKINALELQDKYCDQRHKDLRENNKQGYTFEIYKEKIKNLPPKGKRFQKEYSDVLYDKGSSFLKKYENGLLNLDVKGEIFFMDMHNFVDIDIMEYYPSDEEGFDASRGDTDETTLRRRVQLVVNMLEHHKDRW